MRRGVIPLLGQHTVVVSLFLENCLVPQILISMSLTPCGNWVQGVASPSLCNPKNVVLNKSFLFN